jgi:hypothetical protein
MTLNHLTDTRQADREKIADALEAVATDLGATVERREGTMGRRDVQLNFTLNGVGASIWLLAGLHGGNRAIINWYNEYSDTHRKAENFSYAFNVVTRSANDGWRSHHKATSIPDDWDGLRDYLREGLVLAAEGRAFESEQEQAA